MTNLFVTSALAVFVFMTVCFFISVIRKRNDIVDIAWGLGFILVAGITFFSNGHVFAKQLLVTVLVTIWGLRLAGHIYLRNRNRAEDDRYKQMKKKWKGNVYLNSYLRIFLLQGFLLFLISTPVIFINSNINGSLSFIDGIAIDIWLFGFLFEVIGDYELSQFVKSPISKGKIMTAGLWQYTRHPNYFGEVTQWWGIFLLTITLPYGFLTIISPLLITFLIIKVSGIPLIEKKYAGKADFEAYKKQTSVFFPMFPKKS